LAADLSRMNFRLKAFLRFPRESFAKWQSQDLYSLLSKLLIDVGKEGERPQSINFTVAIARD
jgi:hypothetical protein